MNQKVQRSCEGVDDGAECALEVRRAQRTRATSARTVASVPPFRSCDRLRAEGNRLLIR